MSDRSISSYLVPVVIVLGAALQKNFQSVHILLNNLKTVSQFSVVGWICVVLNFFLLLFMIIMQDYTVSPYALPASAFAIYQFLAGVCYHSVHLVLFYLIIIRMPVVCKKESMTFKVMVAGCILGMLLKLINLVLCFILNIGVINGTYPSQLASPWAKSQSIVVIIAAFFEAAVMIPASYIFIKSIAEKLCIPGIRLVRELALKYAAFDYLIMAGFKLYACIGYIWVIKSIGLASAIFATYIFIHGSFNAPKQLLNDYSITVSGKKTSNPDAESKARKSVSNDE
ncbi:hypothetical protein HDV04_006202 [Boothiomyces sp. JEL0838]|nr:hypothetical protein HDV04_006202 [Boothiomyces sp. JEL0838]